MKILYAFLSLLTAIFMCSAAFFLVYYTDLNEEGLELIGDNLYLYVGFKLLYMLVISFSIGWTGGKLIFVLRQLRRNS